MNGTSYNFKDPESRRTCRAWRVCRAVLFQHGGWRRSCNACVYKLCCVLWAYM